MSAPSNHNLSSEFSSVASTARPRATATYPFCVRFTADESAHLEERAGRKPLGRYIREYLLADKTQPRMAARRPKLDDEQFASLLAALGESRLSSNLNQLARAANCGTLDAPEDVEEQLREAHEAVIAMRDALFVALGLKPPGNRA